MAAPGNRRSFVYAPFASQIDGDPRPGRVQFHPAVTHTRFGRREIGTISNGIGWRRCCVRSPRRSTEGVCIHRNDHGTPNRYSDGRGHPTRGAGGAQVGSTPAAQRDRGHRQGWRGHAHRAGRLLHETLGGRGRGPSCPRRQGRRQRHRGATAPQRRAHRRRRPRRLRFGPWSGTP